MNHTCTNSRMKETKKTYKIRSGSYLATLAAVIMLRFIVWLYRKTRWNESSSAPLLNSKTPCWFLIFSMYFPSSLTSSDHSFILVGCISRQSVSLFLHLLSIWWPFQWSEACPSVQEAFLSSSLTLLLLPMPPGLFLELQWDGAGLRVAPKSSSLPFPTSLACSPPSWASLALLGLYRLSLKNSTQRLILVLQLFFFIHLVFIFWLQYCFIQLRILIMTVFEVLFPTLSLFPDHFHFSVLDS